jgi:type II secretory pathway pseudopilin PulG
MKVYPKHCGHDQRGIAAILITMVVMIVIMLIVLGFATISRREQREALDNQLQTQAFYAAESGVNDAKEIAATLLATGTDASKPECDMGGGADTAYNALKTTLGPAANNVRYSCVIVDPSPEEITNSSVVDGVAWVAPLATDSPPANFTISWNPKSATGNPSPACDFTAAGVRTYQPAAGANARTCQYPVLRVDLFDASTITPDVNAQNRRLHTYYIQPSSSLSGTTPTTTYAPPGGASTVGALTQVRAGCDTNTYGTCRLRINPGTAFTTNMAMRITSLYGASSVTIQAAGEPIKNSQIVIDATGRAQDVLRRIQVRIPVTNTGGLTPTYAVQSGGAVCKRFSTDAAGFRNGTILPGIGTGDPMCASGLVSSVGTGSPAITITGSPPGVYVAQPGDTYRYSVTLTNNTATNGLTVVGCTWYFGDGTTATGNCNPGNTQIKNFALPGDTGLSANAVTCTNNSYGIPLAVSNICTPTGVVVPFPNGCQDYPRRNEIVRRYSARIVVQFSNGTSATSPPTSLGIPYCT